MNEGGELPLRIPNTEFTFRGQQTTSSLLVRKDDFGFLECVCDDILPMNVQALLKDGDFLLSKAVRKRLENFI